MCNTVQCATVQELILRRTPFHGTLRCVFIKLHTVKGLVYDRNHYFGLGPIPKPKPKLADAFGRYRNQNYILKGEIKLPLKYFLSVAAVKIGKKKVQSIICLHLFTND